MKDLSTELFVLLFTFKRSGRKNGSNENGFRWLSFCDFEAELGELQRLIGS